MLRESCGVNTILLVRAPQPLSKGLWIFFELLAYRGVMKMSRRQYRHAHPRLDMLEVRLHSPLLWNSKNTLLLSHEARHESRNTRDLHTHHQHHSEHTTTHMPPPAPPTPSYSRLKYAGCGWIFVWRRTALSTHMCERVDKPRMRGVYPMPLLYRPIPLYAMAIC